MCFRFDYMYLQQGDYAFDIYWHCQEIRPLVWSLLMMKFQFHQVQIGEMAQYNSSCYTVNSHGGGGGGAQIFDIVEKGLSVK